MGTEAARGAVVVWTDADMTYPNDRIAELVGQLEGADQVVGARTTEEGTHKVLRTAAKWLIRRLAQYLASTRIPDLNSGYRVSARRRLAIHPPAAQRFLLRHHVDDGIPHQWLYRSLR